MLVEVAQVGDDDRLVSKIVANYREESKNLLLDSSLEALSDEEIKYLGWLHYIMADRLENRARLLSIDSPSKKLLREEAYQYRIIGNRYYY